jgi:hypothetical protein
LHPRCSSSQSSFLAWSVTEASLASTFAPRASVSLHNLKRCRLSQLSSSAQRRNMSPAPSVQRQPLRAWEASFISGHLFVLSRGASPWHSTHLKTCLSTSSGTCCTQRGVLEQADLTKLRWQPGKARGSSAAIYLAASNPKPIDGRTVASAVRMLTESRLGDRHPEGSLLRPQPSVERQSGSLVFSRGFSCGAYFARMAYRSS